MKVKSQKSKVKSKGKLIVLYGANNLGKTTQAELLVKALKKKHLKTKLIKYPIYDLGPTGPIINSVLRGKLDMEELELQKLFAENRKFFEPTLKKYLEEGFWVVAEDYTGTGIAWGIVGGVSLSVLEKINKGLIKEDLGILLSGKRFIKGREKNHKNEEDDRIWKEAARIHSSLGKKYKWKVVNANGTKLAVHKKIMRRISV